jgi:hypothetical protein
LKKFLKADQLKSLLINGMKPGARSGHNPAAGGEEFYLHLLVRRSEPEGGLNLEI